MQAGAQIRLADAIETALHMPAGSLHHASCGCPGTLGSPAADAAAAAAAAASQVADSLVHNYATLYRLGGLRAERRLRVAYVLPHHHVTGGMKVIGS